MSSNLKVNTILPSTGSNIGIGTNGGELVVDGGCKVQVGTALTLGHSLGVQFATQNLHSTGFEVNQINASGIITASSFSGNPAGNSSVDAGILDLKTGGNIRLRFSSGGTAQFRGDTDPIANFDRGSANSTNVKWGYLGADRGIISSISNEFRIAATGTNPMTFHSNSAERLRIDDHGVLRVGNTHDQTTSGNTKRIALGGKGSIWGWASGQLNGALNLADNYYWDGSNNKAIESDYCAYMSLRQGSLRFGCTASSQTGGQNVSGGIHEKVRFENDGNVSIADGNLSFASGHGIDFSSQSTSQQQNSPTTDDEVLQFYEKGKWTPDVRKNGVSNATASPLHGRYVRIGQMVWLSMYARWASGSNAQGTSGGWQIYGLPFSLQDDNPGTCRIYQFAPAGYFYINGTYYGSARTIRWQCNNNTRLDLYTDLSSSQLAWNSGAMGITFTGCFMIHE